MKYTEQNVRNSCDSNFVEQNGIIFIMEDLTNSDQRLIVALRHNSRASITDLANELSVSRATVQSRLDRLVNTGVIERFTIDLGSKASVGMIQAVMLIEVQGNLARSVVRSLRQMPQIVSLHSTNGAWDLVAHIETTSLPGFDRTLREVREFNGILNSETSLLLDNAKS